MISGHCILIADAQYVSREGIRQNVLECLGKNTTILEAGDSSSLKRVTSNISPDVCIIDYTGEGYFSIADIRSLTGRIPGIKFLVMAGRPGKEDIEELLNMPSVTGFLLKECGKDEVREAILNTLKGERFFCNRVLDMLLVQELGRSQTGNILTDPGIVSCDPVKLGAREIEVIRLIAKGLTNKQIADNLFLSPHTVATHRKNIFRKLRVNNTASVVCFAMDAGILN